MHCVCTYGGGVTYEAVHEAVRVLGRRSAAEGYIRHGREQPADAFVSVNVCVERATCACTSGTVCARVSGVCGLEGLLGPSTVGAFVTFEWP